MFGGANAWGSVAQCSRQIRCSPCPKPIDSKHIVILDCSGSRDIPKMFPANVKVEETAAAF